MKKSVLRDRLLLFVLFWMIALGLGYPSLARYNPREIPGIIDANSYASMVEGRGGVGHHQIRVLIPFLASPIEKLVRGRIGSWNSVQFAMLCVSGFFVAWSALLFVSIGTRVFGDALIGLTSACLFLLSFNVSNFMLAGLVDSVESWAMLATTWALFSRRWSLLPVVGVVAALGKETSLFLMVPFCVTWYALARRTHPPTRTLGLSVMAMIVFQVGTILMLKSLLNIPRVSPSGNPMSIGISALAIDQGLIYTFGWLIPLGILRIRRLPASWIASTCVSAACVVAVGLYFGNGIGGNMTRPFFNLLAPVLLLSTAVFVCESITGNRWNHTIRAE